MRLKFKSPVYTKGSSLILIIFLILGFGIIAAAFLKNSFNFVTESKADKVKKLLVIRGRSDSDMLRLQVLQQYNNLESTLSTTASSYSPIDSQQTDPNILNILTPPSIPQKSADHYYTVVCESEGSGTTGVQSCTTNPNHTPKTFKISYWAYDPDGTMATIVKRVELGPANVNQYSYLVTGIPQGTNVNFGGSEFNGNVGVYWQLPIKASPTSAPPAWNGEVHFIAVPNQHTVFNGTFMTNLPVDPSVSIPWSSYLIVDNGAIAPQFLHNVSFSSLNMQTVITDHYATDVNQANLSGIVGINPASLNETESSCDVGACTPQVNTVLNLGSSSDPCLIYATQTTTWPGLTPTVKTVANGDYHDTRFFFYGNLKVSPGSGISAGSPATVCNKNEFISEQSIEFDSSIRKAPNHDRDDQANVVFLAGQDLNISGNTVLDSLTGNSATGRSIASYGTSDTTYAGSTSLHIDGSLIASGHYSGWGGNLVMNSFDGTSPVFHTNNESLARTLGYFEIKGMLLTKNFATPHAVYPDGTKDGFDKFSVSQNAQLSVSPPPGINYSSVGFGWVASVVSQSESVTSFDEARANLAPELHSIH